MIEKVGTLQINAGLKPQNSNRRIYALAILIFILLAAGGLWYYSRESASNTSKLKVNGDSPVITDLDDYLKKLQRDPQIILKSEDFSELPVHKAIINNEPFDLKNGNEITILSPNYGLSILHCAVLAGNANALNQLLKFQETCSKNVLVALMKHSDYFGIPPLFYHMASPHRKTTDPSFIEICENTLGWTECLFAQRLVDGRSPLHFVSDLEGVDLPDMSKCVPRNTNDTYRELQWQAVKAKWPDQPHPLHYAIKKNRIDVIEWLGKMGCPYTVKSNGKTALEFAKSSNNQNAVDALNNF